jgi:hypothetical protein
MDRQKKFDWLESNDHPPKPSKSEYEEGYLHFGSVWKRHKNTHGKNFFAEYNKKTSVSKELPALVTIEDVQPLQKPATDLLCALHKFTTRQVEEALIQIGFCSKETGYKEHEKEFYRSLLSLLATGEATTCKEARTVLEEM